jgi:hypothetical protein
MCNSIKNGKFIIAALLVSIIAATSSWAIGLSFSPQDIQTEVGESFAVDLVVSGLQETNLAGFDLIVNFDDTILSFLGYTLGDGLGESMDFSLGDLDAGMVYLSEMSFLWDLSFQPDRFSLATLSFEGMSRGASDLFFSDVTLSDDWGDQLDAILDPSSIMIVDGTNPVPEPTTMTLFGVGLILMAGVNRKVNRK